MNSHAAKRVAGLAMRCAVAKTPGKPVVHLRRVSQQPDSPSDRSYTVIDNNLN
jgi:hypothetical protein